MTNTWFSNTKSVKEIRKVYFILAMRWHPDRPDGDTVTMQAINNAYEAALKGCDGSEQAYDNGATHADGSVKTYRYNFKGLEEKQLVDTLAATIAAKLPGVTINLMGAWLWLTGETKACKDSIKGLGFKYAPQKEAWHFHTGKHRSFSRGKYSLDEIASKYGRYEYSGDQKRLG